MKLSQVNSESIEDWITEYPNSHWTFYYANWRVVRFNVANLLFNWSHGGDNIRITYMYLRMQPNVTLYGAEKIKLFLITICWNFYGRYFNLSVKVNTTDV